MTSTPLNYADTPHQHRRWLWRTVGVVAAALLFGLYSLTGTFGEVESRVDAVTGSIGVEDDLAFRHHFRPAHGRVAAGDPAEAQRHRLDAVLAVPPQHAHRNVFGRAICFECGSAPPIYSIRPVLKEFAAASTDAALTEFVRILQTGTEAEQNAAVAAAEEKGFQVLSGAPPRE